MDFEYFKSQPCSELSEELEALKKAEAAVNNKMKKAESKANFIGRWRFYFAVMANPGCCPVSN